jgi:hypothetical protein
MVVGNDGLPGAVSAAQVAAPPPPQAVQYRELSAEEEAAHLARVGLGGKPAGDRRPYVTIALPPAEELGPIEPETIEQVGGRHFSLKAVRALRSASRPRGETAELLSWLWEHEGDAAVLPWRLDGLRAAAWIASRNATIVGRIGLIEYRSERGLEHLRGEQVEHALRTAIAEHNCQCGAKDAGEPESCDCLDNAFGELNRAIRAGELFELGEHSREPVNLFNAGPAKFSARGLQRLFPPPAG